MLRDPIRQRRYVLAIRADRSVRIAKRPVLRKDEVGIEVIINFKGNWGQVVGSVEVDAPPFDADVMFEELGADYETRPPSEWNERDE